MFLLVWVSVSVSLDHLLWETLSADGDFTDRTINGAMVRLTSNVAIHQLPALPDVTNIET